MSFRQLLIELVDNLLLYSIHSVCFSRTCLSISETSYYSILQKIRNQRFKNKLVNIVTILFFIESVIKSKLMVLNVFGDSVYFVLGFMDFDFRIST